MRSFYFSRSDDFCEVDKFVRSMDEKYQLGVDFLTEPDFKKGLVEYLEQTGVQAIVLGTRRGDPNAADQDVFCPSSAGWPPFMRINPILDWTYHDVWQFVRALHADYCSLYDRGYTSLGGTGNTLPNSALKKPDGSFEPAYMLADGRLERAGRVHRKEAHHQSSAPSLTRSAGIVVVGDELLSGKVDDVNASYLCRELRSIGWQVLRVVFVPDDVQEIASTVRGLCSTCEVVLTTGGIGPTLDDVTMAGIAQAVGQPLVRLPELESKLETYFGAAAMTPAHLKMTEAPQSAQLMDFMLDNGQMCMFPIVRVNNVYVLPGVPRLLVQKWTALKPHFTDSAIAPFRNAILRLSLSDETAIAPALERVASTHGLDVALGSYPVDHGIILTLDSKDADKLQAAVEELTQLLPSDSIVSMERDAASL